MTNVEIEPSLTKSLESMQQGMIDPDFLMNNLTKLREKAKLLSSDAQGRLQMGIAKWLLANKSASKTVLSALEGLRTINELGAGIPGKALDMTKKGTTGIAKDLDKGVENLAKFGDKQIQYFSDPAVPVKDKLLWGGTIAGIVYSAKKVVDWAKEDSWRGTIIRTIGLAALGGWLLNRFAPEGASVKADEKKPAPADAADATAAASPSDLPSTKHTPDPFKTPDTPVVVPPLEHSGDASGEDPFKSPSSPPLEAPDSQRAAA